MYRDKNSLLARISPLVSCHIDLPRSNRQVATRLKRKPHAGHAKPSAQPLANQVDSNYQSTSQRTVPPRRKLRRKQMNDEKEAKK
jgi:hypothetical protein